MTKNQSRKRVEKLFAGMPQLANLESSNGNGHLSDIQSQPVTVITENKEPQFIDPETLLKDVENLRARVAELEAQLKESEMRKSAAPIIYEKEEVGFAYANAQIM